MKRGISVVFYSINGSYFGRLISTNHVNVARQRMQADLHKNESFKLAFAKKTLSAKIANQVTVIRRYSKANRNVLDEYVQNMMIYKGKILDASSIEEILL